MSLPWHTRLFAGLTLAGLSCFAALAWISAYVHTEMLMLVMLLYFAGIAFGSIGVVGLLAIGLIRLLRAAPRK